MFIFPNKQVAMPGLDLMAVEAVDLGGPTTPSPFVDDNI
jgi:hypothetical protein